MPPDRPLPDRLPRRHELEAPYRHPFRLSAGIAWRSLPTVRNQAKLAAALIAAGTVAAVVSGQALWLLTAAVGGLLAAWVALVLGAATTSNGVARLRYWRRPSELRAVRERRPHAGAADPEIAHDEFAVTAEDDGWLLTWRLRPLRHDERPDADKEILVPGRPCYAASVVTERRFDAHDTARAAEQLVAAQEDAAAREAAAASTIHGGIADAAARAELAEEARSTAAALQRATGQRGRRD